MTSFKAFINVFTTTSRIFQFISIRARTFKCSRSVDTFSIAFTVIQNLEFHSEIIGKHSGNVFNNKIAWPINFLNTFSSSFQALLSKSKGFKKALVESCQAAAVKEIWIAPIQAIQLFAEKTMFCFESALYWSENKKFVDKAQQCSTFSPCAQFKPKFKCWWHLLDPDKHRLFKSLGL